MTGDPSRPLVSVIVPVRDTLRPPRQTVAALASQSLARPRYEIIVVENDVRSGPAPADYGQPDVIVVRETSALNAYVARNAGLAVARGDIIAFTDADCVPAHDWLARGVEALERDGADLAAGAIRFSFGQPGSAAMLYDATHFLQAKLAVADRGVGFMANLFVRRRVLDVFPALPTDSISGGDVRFCRLATSAGFRLVYAPGAAVEHPARDWRRMIVKALRVGYGKGRLTRQETSSEIVRREMLASPQVRSLNPVTLYRRIRGADVPVNVSAGPLTALRGVAFGYVVAACALAGYAAGLVHRRRPAPRPAPAANLPARRSGPAPAEFAVVLEAINLQLADASRLRTSLESLDAQTLPLREARQVLLVHTGELEEAGLLDECRRFPWLSLHRVPDGVGYEEAKALGAARCSSPLIVFADSDCEYDPAWLEHLLAPFRHDEVEIVGGETAIDIRGAYDLAVALSFSFDGFSDRTAVYEGERFHFNNVAFRARTLAAHPIRFGDPVYRCPRLYATTLRSAGVRIHRQPAAHARHAPPNGLGHFFWRYLFLGHDAAAYRRIVDAEAATRPAGSPSARRSFPAELAHRARCAAKVLTPRRALALPLAAPIALAGAVLGVTGLVIRLVSPHVLLRVAPARFLAGSSFDRRRALRRAA